MLTEVMLNTKTVFENAPVGVNQINGFDMGHLNFITSRICNYTPVDCNISEQKFIEIVNGFYVKVV